MLLKIPAKVLSLIFLVNILFVLPAFSQTSSLSFTSIPVSDPDLNAPGRGVEQWHDRNDVNVPIEGTNTQRLDIYFRFVWTRIEGPTLGSYTWTYFDSLVKYAITRKQKMSFGIMQLYPGGTVDNGLVSFDGGLASYPLYLHTLMQAETVKDWRTGTVWTPNYNSINYQNRLLALHQAIDAHIKSTSFNGVPFQNVISCIDIRGYGAWGEWHSGYTPNNVISDYPAGTFPTVASLKKIVDAHTQGFPDFPLVAMIAAFDASWLQNTMNPPEIAYYVLTQRNNWGLIGWRRDQWGATDSYISSYLENNTRSFNGLVFRDSIMVRWKSAPITGEPPGWNPNSFAALESQVALYHATSFGNGNYGVTPTATIKTRVRAASKLCGYRLILEGGNLTLNGNNLTVALNWKNIGQAPTYENWNVEFELKNSNNQTVWSGQSQFKPKRFLPSGTATVVTDNFTALPAGTFNLNIIIKDPNGYRDPLPLAITGRNADGSYPVKQQITFTSPVPPPNIAVSNNCGSSVLTASGYTGTLLWSTGESTPSITVTAPGLYTVSQTVGGMTSALGSATAAPKAIPSPPGIAVVNNCGNSLLTATGVTGTLVWSTGETTSSITITTTGTYTVTQTVNLCASPPGSATVSPPPLSNVPAPIVNIVNNCGNSVLTATGYTGSLLWSTGATTESISVTTNGTYTVRQTVNYCTSPDGIGVAAPKPTPALNIPLSTIASSGTPFTFLATSNTPGTSFAWSRSAVAGVSNLAATGTGNVDETLVNITASPVIVTYVYTLSANGCTNTQNVLVTVDVDPGIVAPAITMQPTSQAKCAGENVTFISDASGGPAPTVQWQVNTSGTWSNISGATNSFLSFATTTADNNKQYRAVWTNIAGTATSSAVTLTVNSIPSAPSISVANNCGNSLLTASGAAGATFSWSNGGTGSSITVAAGDYTVTQTVNGCTSGPSAIATAAPKTIPGAPSVSVTDNCGSSLLTATGVAGATFTWSIGAPANPITVTSAGNYTVTQTVNGCTGPSNSAAAAPKPVPALTSSLTAAATSSAVFSYSPSSTVTGTTFTWSRAAVSGISNATNSGNGNISETLVNTSASPVIVTYIYTLTTSECTNSQNVLVTVAVDGSTVAPQVTTQPASQTKCAGESVTFTSGASGGPAPTVQWQENSNGNSWHNIAGATTSTLSFTISIGQNNNQYRAVWTNIAGTATSNAAALTVNSIPSAPSISVANNCGSSLLTASGAGGATFSWSNGGTGNSITVAAGDYTVTQTVNGCTSGPSATATAAPRTIPGAPSVSVTDNCGSSLLTATGVAGATFTWSIGAPANPITVTSAGNYTVTQTVNGCTGPSASAPAAPKPVPALTSSLTSAATSSAVFNYSPSSTVTGTTFAWSRAAVSGVSNATNSGSGDINETLVNTTASPVIVTYVYTLTTSECTNTQNVVVTVAVDGSTVAPTITTQPVSQTKCAGESVTFNSGASGGPAPTVQWQVNISGTWNNIGGATSSTLSFTTATADNSKQYRAVWTNIAGTATSSAATLMVNSIPSAPSIIVANNCGSSLLTASGAGGATFSWSNGGTGNSITVAAGDYTVIQSVNGCTSGPSAIATAAPKTIPGAPSVSVTDNCGSSLLTATGDAGATFTWSIGAPANPITVTSAGNYTVTQTVNGCTGPSNSAAAAPKPVPALTSSLTSAATSSDVFNYTPSSNTSGTTFTWSRAAVPGISNVADNGTGNISETLVNTTASPVIVTYVYTLSANECTNTQNVLVTVSVDGSTVAPAITTQPSSQTKCAGEGVTFNSGASGGPAPIVQWQVNTSGTWNNISGATSSTLSFTTTTADNNKQYRAVWTNIAGTATSNAATLIVNSIPSAPSISVANNCGSSLLTASGAGGATFSWSNGGTGNSVTVAAGDYTVTQTVNGCTSGSSPIATAAPKTIPGTPSVSVTDNCGSSLLTATGDAGATFTWSIGAPANPITVTTAGNYTVTQTVNGCTGPSNNATAAPKPVPALTSSLTASATSSAAFSYSPSSTVTGTTFTWSRAVVSGVSNAANTGNGDISETLVNTTASPVIVTYVYTLTDGNCSNTQNVLVTVSVDGSTVAPAMTTQPSSQTKCAGESVTFNSGASGGPAPTVQWQLNTSGTWNNIPGATSSTLSFTTTTADNNKQYRAVWTNIAGTATSNAATLTVNSIPSAPSIFVTNNCGSSLLTASGAGGALFSWSNGSTGSSITVAAGDYTVTQTVNGCTSAPSAIATAAPKTIPGAPAVSVQNNCGSSLLTATGDAGATFTWSIGAPANPITVTSAGNYTVTQTVNGCTGPSNNAAAAPKPVPALTSSLTASATSSAAFSYSPSSTVPGTTFTWSRAVVSGVSNAANNGTGNISETLVNTTASPVIVTYVYTLTDGNCSNTQSVLVTVSVDGSTVAPAVTTQPTSQTKCAGESVTFNSGASGGPAPTVQWQVNTSGTWNNIGGAASSTLSFTTTTADNNKQYRAVWTNIAGTATSNAATLTVNPIPVLSSGQSTTATSGTAFNYTATSSTPGTVFAWSRAVVPGISNVAASGNGNINETLLNTTTSPVNVTYVYTLTANGCTNTQNVVVTVNSTFTSPLVTTQPISQARCAGVNASFTSTASGSPTPTVQWQVNTSGTWTDINGATSGTLSFATATADNNKQYRAVWTNSVGTINSNAATLTVNVVPVLSSNLTATATSGSAFTYTATSSTTGTTFAWSRAVVTGISNTAASGSGNVSEILINTTVSPINVTYVYTLTANGCSNTQNVVVTVNANIIAPTVTTQPASQTRCAGVNASFSSAASGTPAPTVQWQVSTNGGTSWTNVTGATSSTLSFATTTADNNKQYRAVWTNTGATVNSSAATLTVNPTPVLSSGLTATATSGAAFTYPATSSTTGTTFAWSRAAVTGISNVTANGTGNVSETLINTTISPVNVTYVYTLTANGCSNTQNVVVTVSANIIAPVVTTQPASQTRCAGVNASFSSAASGTPAPTVQWQVSTNGGTSWTNVTGATSGTLSFTPTTADNNKRYRAVWTNSGGTVNSSAAILTVNPTPVLSSSLSATATSGTAFTYTATSSTTGTTFAWSRAAVTGISNAAANGTGNINETLLNTTGSSVSVTYVYTLTANGCANTQNVTVTVTAVTSAPVVTTQPSAQSRCSGSNAIFTSAASGSPAPTVQWQVSTNGGFSYSNISGATSSTLTFATTTSDNNRRYRARWTNSVGAVNSSSALLTVNSTPSAPTVSVTNNCGNSVLTATGTGSLLWSTGATTSSITVTTAGTYTVTRTVNGCSSNAASAVAAPRAVAVLSSNLAAAVTTGNAFTYTPTSATTGTTFAWSRAAVTGISNTAATGTNGISETLTNTTDSPINVTYVYTLTANGCTNTQNLVVTVNPIYCVINGAITSSFNSSSIPAGRFIWFNSALARGSFAGITGTVTFNITNSVITFTANSQQYTLNLPNSRIRFDSTVTSATTQFINNAWETAVPRTFTDYVFMGGLSYQVPTSLPGNITNVRWSATITINKAGVRPTWKWAASVYTSFAANSGLNIKPKNGSTQNPYPNNDLAGTPENFKTSLVSGARGTGGTNYTGTYSSTSTATCAVSAGTRPAVTEVVEQQLIVKEIPVLPLEKLDEEGLKVTVLPNPTSSSFNLLINGRRTGFASVKVIDISGRVVERHEKVLPNSLFKLGQRLAAGSYFIEVVQDDQKQITRVIKVN